MDIVYLAKRGCWLLYVYHLVRHAASFVLAIYLVPG